MQNTTEKDVAVFIDADNVQYEKLDWVFETINTYGRIVIKRAYGNWTKDTLKPWINCSKDYAIQQVQQTDYVPKKNTADIALIIDAMDFVSKNDYDIFVIVSSDSDFTPLAIRLREHKKFVVGIGKRETTVEAFVNACDDFKFIPNTDEKSKKSSESKKKNNKLDRLLGIFASLSQDENDGYVNTCDAGQYLKRNDPSFNVADYGAKKLSEYLEKYPDKYETRKIHGPGTVTIIEYKLK